MVSGGWINLAILGNRLSMVARLLPLSLVIVLGGCASNLGILADPEVMPRGKVHVGVGVGAYVPSRPIVNAIDVGVKITERAKETARSGEVKPLSDDEKRSLINAGLAFALQPPSASWEIQVRTGVFENVDVGARYSVNQIRGDVRYRFFHAEKWENGAPPEPLSEGASTGAKLKRAFGVDERLRSYDATVQLGVSYFLFNSFLVEALDAIQMGNFQRWDIDLAVTWGFRRAPHLQVLRGPKFVYTHFSVDEKLFDVANTASGYANEPAVLTQVTNHMFFGGAVVGAAVGYKVLYLYTELTVATPMRGRRCWARREIWAARRCTRPWGWSRNSLKPGLWVGARPGLAGFDLELEVILRWRQRAGGEGGERARRRIRLVEVELDGAIGSDRRGVDVPTRGVARLARGLVFEDHEQPGVSSCCSATNRCSTPSRVNTRVPGDCCCSVW